MYMLTCFPFAPDVFNQSQFETQLSGRESSYLMLSSIWPLVNVFHKSVHPLLSNLANVTVSALGLLLALHHQFPFWTSFGLSLFKYVNLYHLTEQISDLTR